MAVCIGIKCQRFVLVVSEAPAHERTYVDKMVREGQYRLNELGAISATFHLDSERRDLTTTIQYNGKSLKVTRCRIIVNFGPDVSRIAAIEAIRKSDFRILSEGRPDQVIPYYSYVLLIPNEMGIEEAMEKAGRIPGIAEVEPNAVGEWY